MSQQFCLKWNNHTTNMLQVFESLLSTEALVDVTLACDGLSLKAHKMVLSACSPFFQSLFLENPCKHPIVIMKDMRYCDLKAIIDFMYRGEVNVSHDQLSALLKTAETLKVKGLAEVTGENRHASGIVQQEITQQQQQSTVSTPTPTPLTPTAQRTDTPPLQGKRKRGRPRKRSLSDSNRSDDEGVAAKIKERDSPDVEELSGDASMDATSDIRSGGGPGSSNSQSQVHSSNNVNSFSKSHLSISQDPQVDETSGDENEFEVEPSKLLEQTLTTDNVPSSSQNSTGHIQLPSVSGLEISRRSMSSTDSLSQALVPASDSLGSNLQAPDSPQDIKPQILSFDDPPISPVAGPSHSERSMMMYMDQSGVSSIPGPSNYQDNSALVPHDSQPQGINVLSTTSNKNQMIKSGNKILLPLSLPSGPQLFLINSGVWEQPSEIEIVNEFSLGNSNAEIKVEPPDVLDEVFDNSTSKFPIINADTPLPTFSDMIYDHLQENNVSAVWGTFVDECAKYYFGKYPNIQNSSEYQAIGRKMYETYPAIGYEGKEPWSFFCKSLSQKIRHMKWKLKRKKLGLTTRRPIKAKEGVNSLKFHSYKPKVDRRYTPSKLYKALLRELSIGWYNDTILETRIYDILKATHKGRVTWLSNRSHRKMSSLVNDCPCFSVGKYVIKEFLEHLDKTDVLVMLQRFESLFSSVGALMDPPVNNSSFKENIKILKYIEEQIAFHKGRSSYHCKSIVAHKINIPELEILQNVQSIENSSPLLYIFSDGEKIQKAYVAGDKTVITTDTTNFYEALITLIATYYAFSLDYPKTFAQVLGLFQTFIVGESYKGMQSSKCQAFIKRLSANLVLGE
ncbi:uncharacterized protein [Parasteatoda tepidariorum]|uniref:uncharacterized protein n=1 Tax=Parasteatoda tepidariorum TaxID=114398 RepID=UPI001C71B0C6|nr:uncharacterized protein LOC107442231 [Parasteatoda tepidariorum]